MKVVALSAVSAGLDLITALSERQCPVDRIVALDSSRDRSNVAGYEHPSNRPRLSGIPVTDVSHYPLGSEQEGDTLRAIEMDVLLVLGWQRLIPQWLIDHADKGVLGMHGSSRGISAGRGRSPQNWALIIGAPEFEIAVFKIDAGVDAGAVLDTRRYLLTDHDDIVSSYRKTVLLGADMIADILADWDARNAAAQTQAEEDSAYLPQRTDADGAIDWAQSCDDICRLVRALTRPYPGAHSSLESSIVRIWRARAIGTLPLKREYPPGTVVDVAGDGTFVVSGGDGYLIVDAHDANGATIAPGIRFASVAMADTLAAIAERHVAKLPEQTLSADFLALLERSRR